MQTPATNLHTTELILVYESIYKSTPVPIPGLNMAILVDGMNSSYDSGNNMLAVELLLNSLSSKAAYMPLIVQVGQCQEYMLIFCCIGELKHAHFAQGTPSNK